MNVDEAFDFVKNTRPGFVYVSGKTSTGKSTFAGHLRSELGYQVIDLDAIVDQAVIQPFRLKDRGDTFREVYKERSRTAWIEAFTDAARTAIKECQRHGQAAVLDGAVANPVTLQEILSAFPEATIFYFHPADLQKYRQYLTNRFQQTSLAHQAGLPQTFWRLIGEAEFQQFCQDRILTPGIVAAIADYAVASQPSSDKRLAELRQYFPAVRVIDI